MLTAQGVERLTKRPHYGLSRLGSSMTARVPYAVSLLCCSMSNCSASRFNMGSIAQWISASEWHWHSSLPSRIACAMSAHSRKLRMLLLTEAARRRRTGAGGERGGGGDY